MTTEQIVTIKPRRGYVKREGDSLLWIEIGEGEDSPAFRRVELPMNLPEAALAIVLAWIAYPQPLAISCIWVGY